jgi:hypothetical protein
MAKKSKNPQKGSSQQKGQNFEELIEKLEKMLATSDIKVEHNVQIYDEEIEDTRQIDVLLRIRTGAYEFIVIIECRDRSAVEDVIWIEQLAAKGKAVHANKTVAVSSSGFTKNAIKKARKHGIVLRKIENIGMADLADWFKVSQVKLIGTITEFIDFKFVVSGKGIFTPEAKDILYSQLDIARKDPLKPFFYIPRTNEFVSLQTIWRDTYPKNTDMVAEWTSKLAQGAPAYFAQVNVPIKEPLEVPGTNGALLREVTFRAKITQNISYASPSRILKYQEEGNALAYFISFEKKIGDHTLTIDFVKSNEEVEVTVTSSPNATLSVEEYSEKNE